MKVEKDLREADGVQDEVREAGFMQLRMEERALPMKRLLFLPGSQVWFQELRIHHYPEARLQGSEVPVSR